LDSLQKCCYQVPGEQQGPWIAFKSVVTKFLGNNKDPDYVTIVANMLENSKSWSA
jgi:hypothetical protein